MVDKLSSKKKLTKKEQEKLKKENQKKNVNMAIVILVFITFAIAMVFVTIYITYDTIGNSKYFDKYNKVLSNELKGILDNQTDVDNQIVEASSSGKYSIDEPLIMNNPYGISPLTSLIIFNTLESVSVEVYVNDTFVTTVAETTDHVIPIYGLYANAKNNVTLKCSNGLTNTYEIVTEAYDNDLNDYNLAQNIEDYKSIFVIGPNYTKQILRGFDQNNNLIFYLDLDNISSVAIQNERFYVGYNDKSVEDNDMADLKLEMDYLGRIYSIETNTLNLIYTPNLYTDDTSYIMIRNNMYNDITNNYVLTQFVDNISESDYTTISAKDIDSDLVDATIYTEDYDLAVNGDYITFDFGDTSSEAALLLVNRSDNYVYKYYINNTHYIKVSDIKEASLYLYNNGTYYNLLSTYEN